MKVLACHNYYQQPGGEDQSFAQETDLLEARGHEVTRYTVHNDAIDGMSGWSVARRTFWNRECYAEVRELIRSERPDILHCTNTFPLISSAVYYAAHREGVAVVQSLRNYRMICPAAYLLRDGRICEDCLGKAVPWPAIAHGCYRDSRAASAVVAGMLTFHRTRKTWQRAVDIFYALTEFGRQKFIEGGLPAQKVAVKPNFLSPDPGPGAGQGGYAAFVGRLSPEKGVDTLLDAWQQLPAALPLRIAGDGPMADRVRAAADQDDRIEWLGRLSPDDVSALLADADFLVLPSLWYEGLPRTILEAYARGTPVLASRLGAMVECVVENHTGRLFPAGDAAALASAVQQLMTDRGALMPMRAAARREFETKYSADRNYEMLMGIYERALTMHQKNRLMTNGKTSPTKGALLTATQQPSQHVDMQIGRNFHEQPKVQERD